MVNINDVKKGDLLTLRGEVTTVRYPDEWGSAHVDLDNIIRVHFDSDGDIAGDIEIIGHDPKAIKEPTGLGAVVTGKMRSIGHPITIVRISNEDRPWKIMGYNLLMTTWDAFTNKYHCIEVLNEGVEL